VAVALAVLVLLLLAALALLAFAWKASGDAMHPGAGSYDWNLDDFPRLQPEDVRVNSRTGAVLAGRFFSGSSRATVVLVHGYGGNQDEMLPVASALNDAGFSVFSFDLRGCGRSTGEVTFGAREQDDLASVVDYLTTRDDVDAERIGALAFSMGAATTLMTAAHDTRIKAVVDDSGWSDVRHWLRPRMLDVFIHPRDRFTPLSLKLVELRSGIDFDRLRPRDVVARIAPRPLLIVHGSEDDVVPPSDGDELLAAAREPKELWRVDGAAHTDTLRPGGATSSDRVVSFFRRALGAGDPTLQTP
jgi:pimeloyl-ACP methyl ester carboxylesterase